MSRDVDNLGAELLRVVARAGAKAVARGAESVLADARRGVAVIDKRIGHAISRSRMVQELLDNASAEGSDEEDDRS